jgi:peroxiredoxin
VKATLRIVTLSLLVVVLAACGSLPARPLARGTPPPAPSERVLQSAAAPALAASLPLAVGASAPDFTLAASTGADVHLADELSLGGPVVLVFYTSARCRVCAEALAQLEAQRPAFEAEGAHVLAIATQTPAGAALTAQNLALDYAVLADSEAAVARQYGVRPLLPGRPKTFQSPVSIFVVGPGGQIAWGGPMPLNEALPLDSLLAAVSR